MILTIDNFDGAGARDYTSMLDAERLPKIVRKLNRPAQAELSLQSDDPQFVVPSSGARIKISRSDGHQYFTGYLPSAPIFEYLGWGQRGPVHKFLIQAISDEWVLDRKRISQRPPFTSRTAGSSLRQLTEDSAPGAFDTSEVQDLESQPAFAVSPQRRWSEHATDLALLSRAAYRAHDGKISLIPLGGGANSVNAADETTWLEQLKLHAPDQALNDVTVLGKVEPGAYVKNYFLGDGLSAGFNLSHTPFTNRVSLIFQEEFKNGSFNPLLWNLQDPSAALSVSAGKLQINGGNGADGQTTFTFAEQVQLGGALRLQHGELEFSAPTDALIGGLYAGAVMQANCLAGFRISPAGAASSIQAIVNGSASGPAISTIAGHRYALTTRLFSREPYRNQQLFHSSAHPAGNGRGGSTVSASVRIVLEAHDIDPANPGSLQAPSTVLFDGIVNNAPGFCTYALVNALNAHCTIAFARMSRGVDAEVRSTIPTFSPKTHLTGNVAEGAECVITSGGVLLFFSPYIPVSNEAIVVRYRTAERALARVVDAINIAANAKPGDDGVRAAVLKVLQPPARTSVDCESAALAILEDSTQQAWKGEYECWSDLMPGGANADPIPGEALSVVAASRNANFNAIIHAVEIEMIDPSEDRRRYKISFANESAESNGFQFADGVLRDLIDAVVPGTGYIDNIPDAEITAISSTIADINAGAAPPFGGGIEVRRSDTGWNPDTDYNLVGRFTSQSFTVPRLARVQTYYLRQYDSSSPRKYSRFSTVLYIDYPF